MVNAINVPKTKIEFGCNSYSIGGVSKQFGMNIFAPSSIVGESLISHTLSWNVPYKVTNLLYLTDPKIRYVFISDDIVKELYGSLPPEINKEHYNNFKDIEINDEREIRIIFSGQDPDFMSKMEEVKVTALKIDGDKEIGSIEFFEVEDNKFVSKGISYYLGKNSLIGAIFSDNFENYECVMEGIFEKLNVVSQVYEEKTSKLRLLYKEEECEQFYDQGSIILIREASTEFGESSIKLIDFNAKNLDLQNKQAGLFSCPLIY